MKKRLSGRRLYAVLAGIALVSAISLAGCSDGDDASLERIQILKTPAKTQGYVLNELVDIDGIQVDAVYSDGSTQALVDPVTGRAAFEWGIKSVNSETEEITVDPKAVAAVPGQRKVTVLYGGKTDDFFVTVEGKLVGIDVNVDSVKALYPKGGTFDAKSLVVSAVYDAPDEYPYVKKGTIWEKDDDNPEGYVLSAPSLSTVGTAAGKVTYQGFEKTFLVGVYDPADFLTVALSSDNSLEVYNQNNAEVVEKAFVIAWKAKKDGDGWDTTSVGGTGGSTASPGNPANGVDNSTYATLADKIILSFNNQYAVQWFVDGGDAYGNKGNPLSTANIIEIDSADYTMGAHVLTVKAGKKDAYPVRYGIFTETVKFEVVK